MNLSSHQYYLVTTFSSEKVISARKWKPLMKGDHEGNIKQNKKWRSCLCHYSEIMFPNERRKNWKTGDVLEGNIRKGRSYDNKSYWNFFYRIREQIQGLLQNHHLTVHCNSCHRSSALKTTAFCDDDKGTSKRKWQKSRYGKIWKSCLKIVNLLTM